MKGFDLCASVPKDLIPTRKGALMKPTFIKTYFIFVLSCLLVVIPLELLFSPNHSRTIAEHGLGYFIQTSLLGMVILFAVLSLVGIMILLKKGYNPLKMGTLSFVLGFFIEFVFMKPDWVQVIGSFRLSGGVLVAIVLSAIYWFAVWGVPSYVIQYLTKGTSA